jgi:endonuclease YncB( thermonuclease family)
MSTKRYTEEFKVDRYGRLIGKIEYNGRDANLELVWMGLAWWYRKYASEQSAEERRSYEAAGATAREGKGVAAFGITNVRSRPHLPD